MVAVDEITILINAENKKLDSGLKAAKKSLLDFKGIASTALGFSVANAAQAGAQAVVQFSKQSVKAALDYEQAMQSLKLQSSSMADALVSDLKKASNNTVSSLNLVKSANRALA